MNQGWIKLHRRLLEWEWYDDINTKVLFIHLLLKANHKPKNYKGTTINRGELMTGQDLLALELGLSRMKIRTSLNKLKLTNEITINATKKGTVIQIVNYDSFQEITNTLTTNQPTDNQQITINKKDKKEKKFIVPTLEEVSEYCKARNNDVSPRRFIDFYESKGWMVGRNKMKDWKASVRNWEKPKDELPPISQDVAKVALSAPPQMQSLLNKGYTEEQIKNYAK